MLNFRQNSQTSGKIGDAAETIALNFLKAKGLRFITRNFKTKLGEIDLIFQDAKHLIFIEIKARKSHQYGHPAEFVNFAKQKKIIRTAMIFLQKNKVFSDIQCRFDVITLSTQDPTDIHWIQDAFQAYS